MSVELVRYDAMCRAIADVHRLDEVKDIRDQARALELYARQANNLEAEDRCKEIRLRAEHKWGRLRTEQGNAQGRRNDLVTSGNEVDEERRPTLEDMGVTRRQSVDWQKLGAVPDDEFEAALAERRVEQLITRPSEPTAPVGADVLWLWGRLREFRERGLLEKTPNELADTATEHMLEEIREIAPIVADWLSKWSDYV